MVDASPDAPHPTIEHALRTGGKVRDETWTPCSGGAASTGAATSGAAELEALLETLRSLRASALAKLDGIDEDEARRTTVPSGTNLAGLIQHLPFVEAKWFEQIVGSAGGRPAASGRCRSTGPCP